MSSLKKRQSIGANTEGVHEWVGNHIKRIRAALERLEGRGDIVRSPDFQCGGIKAERANRRLSLDHLLHCQRIADVDHDRQPPKTGDDLTQNFEPFGSSICHLARQAGDVAARSRQTRD
jgi:hypothetical protein